MARNPLEVLGVPPGSDLAAIKQAFRQKAKDLHPDRNPDPRATARFRELVAAYQELERFPHLRFVVPPPPPAPRAPRAPDAARATAAVDFDPRDFVADEADHEVLGIDDAAFCTRRYQSKLERIVVSSVAGGVLMFWVAAFVSHF